ncbi:helix-turn-helix domain-containing protein [Pedobacter sp. AW31-3R]|uniref:helix-turn-helix domain-containing protein n=1 Tax=Pedobacter sp. AW31-3R TaxID=3445781 RepID=UPI003FA122E8
MKYIIAIGIFQAVAAIILLWRSSVRNQADGLLVMLLACIGSHLSVKFFIYSFVTDVEVLNMMNTFIGFCYVPLLYLYTLKIIRPDFIPASKWYVFIPFMLGAIGYFSVASVLIASPDAGHDILYWYNTITMWTMVPLDLMLIGLIMVQVRQHLQTTSDEKKLIIQTAGLFILLSVLAILFFIFGLFFHLSYNYVARSIIYTILIVICIRIITYRYSAFIHMQQEIIAPDMALAGHTYYAEAEQGNVLNQSRTGAVSPKMTDFSSADGSTGIALKSSPSSEKRKELLGTEEMLTIVLKLETAMTTEGYYKDSELTLDKLSALTNQNKYHISEALNHFLHKPFYTFVNEYRIEYIKNRLAYLSKMDIEVNMLTLAYDAGFNSKSSFNRYFKEFVGQTPTTYLKMLSQNIEMAD